MAHPIDIQRPQGSRCSDISSSSRHGAAGATGSALARQARRSGWALFLTALLAQASGCGFNEVVERDEEVKQAWSEVENQYQRRLDLVPNLVATVKGSANFEQETLTAVIEARAKATQVKIDASTVDDPARLKAFEESQAQLSGSLGRLMVVAERYPELKASAAFRDLQGQLEGTENRIAVARQRFGTQVAAYNKVVLVFPSLLGARLRGKGVRPTFSSTAGADKPPQVQF